MPIPPSTILQGITATAQVLNTIRSGVAYLEARGLGRDKINALLAKADEEGRDITDAEVAAAIGGAEDSVERLRAAIEAARTIHGDT